MKKYIIAIDGPAGAGKSTVSKSIAKKLGYLYIDTGAMYRAIALKAIKNNLSFDKTSEIIEMARKTDIELWVPKDKNALLDIIMDGASAIGEIRRILQEKQRKIGKNGGVVMEGRDIGTVVFPNADYKFYMDASVQERAMRRYKELKLKGEAVNLEMIEKEIVERDERDTTRQADPLRKDPGAIYIDSTGLSIDESADVVIDYINKNKHG